jgi:hypothetical protein
MQLSIAFHTPVSYFSEIYSFLTLYKCVRRSSVAFRLQLFQVERKTKKIELRGHIRPAPGQKTLEIAVAFQCAEGALYLDGAVDPKLNATLCCDVLLRLASKAKNDKPKELQVIARAAYRVFENISKRSSPSIFYYHFIFTKYKVIW